MLNIKKTKKELFISSGERLIIDTVEKDTSLLKDAVSSFTGKSVEISFEGLKNIDTTYVQLFLSLITTLKKKSIPIHFLHINDKVTGIFNIYGISIEQLIGDQ